MASEYAAVFFDWDGVITDSVNIKTEAFEDMFQEFGKHIQEKVREHHLQNGGMSRFEKLKYYYHEFLGIDIDEAKIQTLAHEFSELVMEKVIAAPFIAGAVKTVKQEYEKGTKLFVVTGTPTEEAVEIAKQKRLYSYFAEICGSPTKKGEHVGRLLKEYFLTPQQCLFIGDAMADYEAAQANDVPFLGIKIPSCKTLFPSHIVVRSEVVL